MATECPRCGLINPPAARHCDCGYDLATRPALAERELGLRALFLSLDGRIGRATYWLKFLLPYAGVWIGLVYLDRTLGTFDRQTQLGLCSGIFLVVTLYPYIAVAV